MSFSDYVSLREGNNETLDLNSVLENLIEQVSFLNYQLNEGDLVVDDKVDLLIESLSILNEGPFSNPLYALGRGVSGLVGGMAGGAGRAMRDVGTGIKSGVSAVGRGASAVGDAIGRGASAVGKVGSDLANKYIIEPNKISSALQQIAQLKADLSRFTDQIQLAAQKNIIRINPTKINNLRNILATLDKASQDLNTQMADRSKVAKPQYIR
jgi:hypothetical protein